MLEKIIIIIIKRKIILNNDSDEKTKIGSIEVSASYF